MDNTLDLNTLPPEVRKQIQEYLMAHKLSGAGGMGSMGIFSPQQEASIGQMGDIGGTTDELSRQMKMAEWLRDKVGTGAAGGGVGGNIARAGYGISSAIADYRARKLQDELRKKRGVLTNQPYTIGDE